MICKVDACDRPAENKEKGLCATHSRRERKTQSLDSKEKLIPKGIKLVSDKKRQELNDYRTSKKEFFSHPENLICKVCGEGSADSIHHGKGRVGYADDEARMNGITLLLDQRFWVPIHSFRINKEFGVSCHAWVETHPEFARSIGVTKSRLSK